MNILLVGEYSGLQNNLKDGLIKLGHNVLLAASGDGFKKLPADLLWEPRFESKIGKLDLMWRIWNDVRNFKKFDVVQFVNPVVMIYQMGFNEHMIKKIMNKSRRSYLLAAGDDSVVWNYFSDPAKSASFDYNWIREITRLNDIPDNKEVLFPTKWTDKLVSIVDKVIPIAYEYKMAYSAYENVAQIHGMPINVDKVHYQENKVKNNKLVILHGLNRESFKGTAFVKAAFEKLAKRYPNDLELIIQGNMPQKDYFDLMSRTNVILDQTNSYSLGMNALFAMAMGKVVLGGAEPENSLRMGYDYCPAINILPSVKDIEDKITQLLDQRNEISDIGFKSRQFVEEYHHYVKIARQFEAIYQS
jgi:glycosyltransferase involved in cell wall biosynthesis